jgi:hypothetical protein
VTGPGRTRLRAGLVLLALTEAVTGAWQYFRPRSFYRFPAVAAGGPFNEHLMSDVGGLVGPAELCPRSVRPGMDNLL